MVDYIISTKPTASIHGFEHVNSVKDINRLSSKSYLIFESSVDKDFELAIFLIKSVQTYSIEHIAYIAENPSPIIDEIMKALRAYREPMPSYIDSVQNITDLMQIMRSWSPEDLSDDLVDNLAVLDGYVHEKLSKEPKALQRQIGDSFNYVVGLLDSLVVSDVLRNQIQELIIDFILTLSRSEEEVSKLNRDLENLKNSNFGLMQGVSAFQQYTYTGTAKVLLIKEHSPVKYLTSFLISFVRYMTDIKTVKSKLIIVDRESDMVTERYGEILRADSTSVKNSAASLTLNQVVYTTTPINSVMDTLMDSVGIELYVILDRTNKKSDLVAGRNIIRAHAASSRRLMRKFGLQAGDTILNDLGEQSQLSVLSMIERYPRDVEARVDIQQRAFETNMKNLSTFAGIKI